MFKYAIIKKKELDRLKIDREQYEIMEMQISFIEIQKHDNSILWEKVSSLKEENEIIKSQINRKQNELIQQKTDSDNILKNTEKLKKENKALKQRIAYIMRFAKIKRDEKGHYHFINK